MHKPSISHIRNVTYTVYVDTNTTSQSSVKGMFFPGSRRNLYALADIESRFVRKKHQLKSCRLNVSYLFGELQSLNNFCFCNNLYKNLIYFPIVKNDQKRLPSDLSIPFVSFC